MTLGSFKLIARFGDRAIPDPRTARPKEPFRGRPELSPDPCPEGCRSCVEVCPTGAVTPWPRSIDLGRCLLCGACARACPGGFIRFTNDPRIAARRRDGLVVRPGDDGSSLRGAALAHPAATLYRKSFKLRQVSAGGCNACEMELNASGNINFDMGRYGVEFVASPRHADAVYVTGPVSGNMAAALAETWRATPEPKFLILSGACAISGGVFAGSPALARDFLDSVEPALYIPGCPAHPLTVLNALVGFIGA